MNIRILVGIIFATFVSHIAATVKVVATSGGTYTSVQAGVSAANAGDTVFVKMGVYNETLSFPKSGSADSGYITLIGESGAIVDGTGKGEVGISISGKSYIRVIGMEIQQFSGSGTPMGISVDGGSGFLEIRNNKVHTIENASGNAHGIAFYGNNATGISNILVDGNEIRNCKLGQSEALVLNGNVSLFTVSNNIVHDNDNIGIDFIGFEGTCSTAGLDQARDGICVNNIVYNISSKTNPTYGGEQSADGIYVDGGKNIVIERNWVYNCDIGIELASEWKGKSTQDITVRNNFISGSYQANIMAGGYDANRGNAVNITIVNNTTYQGIGGELALQFNCNTIVVKNNIFYAKSNQDYLQNWGSNNQNISVDNNLYYGASTTTPGDWTDASAKYVNPKLVNGAVNMHISATSPAINAGIDVGNNSNGTAISGTLDIDNAPRVVGAKIDIGADEFETPSMIEQNTLETGFRMYPNPATGYINLQFSSEIRGDFSLIITDISARRMLTEHFTVTNSIENKHIDISSFNCGVYYVTLMEKNTVIASKLFIKK